MIILYTQATVRLAQLVERYIDIVEVTGSSPVSDTKVQGTRNFVSKD